MSKRVLVTGVCGFAGRHLCEYLAGLEAPPQIIGADVASPAAAECESFHQIDLSCATDVADVLQEMVPDYIIHLAGRFGSRDPQEVYRANVLSMAALLEGARRHVPNAVIVAAGSAAEWGRVRLDQLPITEAAPCRPVTPYGLSKLLATQIAWYYHRVHGLCTMIVRPFQLIGKGVSAQLAPGAFVEQLRLAMRQGSPVIRVGNLETYRDYLDVRDAMRAVWMLCETPAAGESFNLCTGKPTKTGDLLQMMVESCNAQITVEVDPARLRGASEIQCIYGDYGKLRAHSGWEPEIDLAQSVREALRD
ncbi:MAG: NAD-dependent epimerase/dehydratase family protein [Phycisphaerales bacterium]|nr:MAG: NAD-dependent epimerase/dehydratase family protein [Phycisphaerales bacterium]